MSQAWRFLLSHQLAGRSDRCFRLGPVHVCSRCLGLYPVLALGLVLQLLLRAPLTWREDMPLAVFLTLPGLLDFCRGLVQPWTGSNPLRTLTGALLGLALSRTLYVHLHRPWPAILIVQLSLVAAFAVPSLAWRQLAAPTNP